MFETNIQMPTVTTIISTATSVAAVAMLIRSIAREYIPYELQYYISSKIWALFSSISSEVTIIINEVDGMVNNQLFYAADLYLGTKLSPSTHTYRATLPMKETKILLSMDKNQQVIDTFNGVKVTWRRVAQRVVAQQVETKRSTNEVQHYTLRFHKKHKDMVFTDYFQHILAQAQELKKQIRTPKLHTLDCDMMCISTGAVWQSVNIDHPATFDTLAMDMEMKKTIMEDLDSFVKRKDFYRKVGKAWKRGYLLYGPPGTGKSSLIAAMANYLNFDIYDLELTDIRKNSDLRKVLIATANRSILVVEDIDCSVDLQSKMKERQKNYTGPYYRNEVTLSGLLNFIDGLWSSCGDERIIVFTTNHKDRLDPALLRPGRMDMHVHMSYCTPSALRIFCSNYLAITEHPCLAEIEQMVQEAKVTPAEVAEHLMKSEDPAVALRSLRDFIIEKKRSEDLRSTQQKEVQDVENEEPE